VNFQDDPRRHLGGYADRRTRICGWLAKPPTRCTRVRLFPAGVIEECLGEWQKPELVPELADTILTQIADHLEESGKQEQQYVLFFEGRENEVLQTKKISIRRAAEELSTTLDSGNIMDRIMQGDERSQVALANTLVLGMTKMQLGMFSTLMNQALEMNRMLLQERRASDQDRLAAQERLMKYREEVANDVEQMQKRQAAGEDFDKGDYELKKKFLDLIERGLNMKAMAAMAGANGHAKAG
jgi:hypothetical protein